jgi:hypothetical protein
MGPLTTVADLAMGPLTTVADLADAFVQGIEDGERDG